VACPQCHALAFQGTESIPIERGLYPQPLSFEAIAHEPGGPGRVFLLDENDVADRLAALEEVSDGMLRWSETAGLKQVVRDTSLSLDRPLRFVDVDYEAAVERKAA